MKATVFKIKASLPIDATGIDIEADRLEIKEGCYRFYNRDCSEPPLPKEITMAVFPISKFYIIRNEE